jgi:methylthioribose-1-phosphate isomerase
VAAPTSTIDMKTDPDEIVIEERDPDEVRIVMKKIFVSILDVDVYNPAFDVTPPDLISAIITERGIAKPPYDKSLKKLF